MDDPSSLEDEFKTKAAQDAERERLHDLIKSLVKWETTDESREDSRDILNAARYEIAKSVARTEQKNPPPNDPFAVMEFLKESKMEVYDPFAGGGAIPLEAQRLGLRAAASDLNPVAVLINRAMIDLAPKHSGRPPVNPDAEAKIDGKRLHGLAEDIRYYGQWMRDRAFERIGHFYPKATLQDGAEATVIAWLWARTVPCSNPACSVHMPLMRTLQVSKKEGNEHWTRPVFDRSSGKFKFYAQNNPNGLPETLPGGQTVSRTAAVCIACGTNTKRKYVREQAQAGRTGTVMTAIVADGNPGRIYLTPNETHLEAAENAEPKWKPTQRMPDSATLVSGRGYGVTHWRELFTQRQMLALTTFCDLVPEVHEKIKIDGADQEYADAVLTYLAMAVSKYADYGSSFAAWHASRETLGHVFVNHSIPMVLDYAEVNPFSSKTGNIMAHVEWIAKAVERLPKNVKPGRAFQSDATVTDYDGGGPVIATDPPYYDNISYAELSDFFYVWLRPLLQDIHPDLFGGILTPKDDEMIAAPRFGDKDAQRKRFEELMLRALKRIQEKCSTEYLSSIFYAYKAEVVERGGRASTGWETFLNAVIKTEMEIRATWAMRTESLVKPKALKAAALASSVVLVCLPRPGNAPRATRNEYVEALKEELPRRLAQLEKSCQLAPVDFVKRQSVSA